MKINVRTGEPYDNGTIPTTINLTQQRSSVTEATVWTKNDQDIALTVRLCWIASQSSAMGMTLWDLSATQSRSRAYAELLTDRQNVLS